MPMTCLLCDPHRRLPASTHREYLDQHYNRAHGHLAGLPDELTGPGQSWHERAVAAVTHLAKTRDTFTFYDVAQLAGEPERPQSQWGMFAKEVRHLGIAEPCGYADSNRPGTRGSAVKVWRRPTERKVA